MNARQQAKDALHRAWFDPRYFFGWLTLLAIAAALWAFALRDPSPQASNLPRAIFLGLATFALAVDLAWALALIPALRRPFTWLLANKLPALACGIALVAVAIGAMNWHARRVWNRFVVESVAAGEALAPAAVIPPPIPDTENFFASPLFKPLLVEIRPVTTVDATFECSGLTNLVFPETGLKPRNQPDAWLRGKFTDLTKYQAYFRSLTNFPASPQPQSPGADVLRALSKMEPEHALLREAANRPKALFPVRYEDSYWTVFPHHSALDQLTRLCRLRALAELSEAQTNEAAVDVLLVARLADSLATEPALLSLSKRQSLLKQALATIWEGTTGHKWSDRHLAQFEQWLSTINLPASLQLALRGERNIQEFLGIAKFQANPKLISQWDFRHDDSMAWLTPTAFYDDFKVQVGSLVNETIRAIDPVSRRFNPTALDAIEARVYAMTWPHPLDIRPHLPAPLLFGNAKETAYVQAGVDLARVAIALERHRLKHGALPENLGVLDVGVRPTGGFPRDVVTGEPLRYKPTSNGRFLLYSTGWNGVDDGGKMGWHNSSKSWLDHSKGDWVWPQPE